MSDESPDLSCSSTSVFYKAAESHQPNDAAPFIALLSSSAAKEQVDYLLYFFSLFENVCHSPLKRCCLDKVLVLILDGKDLLCSDAVSSDDLIRWLRLTYSYGLHGQTLRFLYPLFGVISRLLRFVNDSNEIKNCFTFVVDHLQPSFNVHGESDSAPFLRLLAQLLKQVGHLEKANWLDEAKILRIVSMLNNDFSWILHADAVENFCAFLEHSAGLLRQGAITEGGKGACLLSLSRWSTKLLDNLVDPSAIRLASMILHQALEVGLIPPLHSRGNPSVCQNWSFDNIFRSTLPKRRLPVKLAKTTISLFFKMAIWLSASGTRLDANDRGKRRCLAFIRRYRLPAFTSEILFGVSHLQQICARTVRSKLRGSISEMSQMLPLPPIVQSYVARDFLDHDLCRVDSLVECVFHSASLVSHTRR